GIDVGYVAQIEHDLRTLAQQFLDGVPQAGRLFAKHNAAATVHYEHAFHRSGAQSQLHKSLLVRTTMNSSPKAYRAETLRARTKPHFCAKSGVFGRRSTQTEPV